MSKASDVDRKVLTEEEMITSTLRSFDNKDSRPCRRCQKMWVPGFWNFHGLCDECFELFDDQKTKGRHEGVAGHYESANAWIKDNPVEQEMTEDLE